MHRSLYAFAAAAITSACIAVPPPVTMPGTALGPRDSLALVFETGRRDAMLLHPGRMPVLLALGPAVGLLAATKTVSFGRSLRP